MATHHQHYGGDATSVATPEHHTLLPGHPSAPPAQSALAVVSDDVLFRRGILATTSRSGDTGLRSAASSVRTVLAGRRSGTTYDVAVVQLESAIGLDQLAGASAVDVLEQAGTAAVIVAVSRTDLPASVRLRVREAGASFLAPYRAFAADPDRLLESMRTGSTDPRWRLPTPWELREQLGYRWTGRLQSLLDGASELPAEAWTTNRIQGALPVDRKTIRRMRQIAYEAGVPAPDFRRYAASTRRAPEVPEWAVVRSLVRTLWGMDDLPARTDQRNNPW